MSENYYNKLQHLLKTQLELQTGTYKRMPNQKRLEIFNKDYQQFFDRVISNKYYTVTQTCTTDCKVGSTNKSFKNSMKPITIKEMTLGTTYRDRYIKLEIVTGVILMASVMFLGKDDNEDLVLIAIYNFEKHYGTKDYKQLSYIFEKGKNILVLEPFYKMFGSGEDGIRIEDPNEIIIFDDKEWLNKFLNAENIEESFKLFHDDEDYLYKEAYKAFSIENYNTALAHFIKLKSVKPNEIKFDIKIAECYYGIPYYSKAIEKCDEIINKNIINDDIQIFTNILQIKLKSLISLKKINEAKKLIDENIQFIEKNKPEFFLIEEEIKRKMKNMEGKYDFYEIYNMSKESASIDIGEYMNKKIEIKYKNNKGLSIYSNEQIKRGELLVVSKAIVIKDQNKKENKSNKFIQFDNPEKRDYSNPFNLEYKLKDDLEETLSYKLSNFPEDFRNFFCLFDGKNNNLNLEERKKNINNDLRKIQNVIQYNSKTIYFAEEPSSYGLWYIPSLFNHSCIPNCFNFGFGDILIIIALNDIEPNTELFISYFYNDMPYDKRQKYLKSYYNFDCKCELCSYEAKKLKENNEKKILEEYLNILDNNIQDTFNFETKTINYEKILDKKEIAKMVKFIENNKKVFSCFEKSNLYLKCAHCVAFTDPYLSYEYLEKSLKYSENRNYYFEKLTLFEMIKIAKQLRSEARLEYSNKKFREFWEKYYPEQKKFIELCINEYIRF